MNNLCICYEYNIHYSLGNACMQNFKVNVLTISHVSFIRYLYYYMEAKITCRQTTVHYRSTVEKKLISGENAWFKYSINSIGFSQKLSYNPITQSKIRQLWMFLLQNVPISITEGQTWETFLEESLILQCRTSGFCRKQFWKLVYNKVWTIKI